MSAYLVSRLRRNGCKQRSIRWNKLFGRAYNESLGTLSLRYRRAPGEYCRAEVRISICDRYGVKMKKVYLHFLWNHSTQHNCKYRKYPPPRRCQSRRYIFSFLNAMIRFSKLVKVLSRDFNFPRLIFCLLCVSILSKASVSCIRS